MHDVKSKNKTALSLIIDTIPLVPTQMEDFMFFVILSLASSGRTPKHGCTTQTPFLLFHRNFQGLEYYMFL